MDGLQYIPGTNQREVVRSGWMGEKVEGVGHGTRHLLCLGRYFYMYIHFGSGLVPIRPIVHFTSRTAASERHDRDLPKAERQQSSRSFQDTIRDTWS